MEKQYNSKQSEEQIRTSWQEQNTYQFKPGSAPLYSIDTPPPTVSGNLHIGHVFSYTQTDIIARFKRLQGFNVFYPFGFDDNGLPTERYVEKKRDVAAYKMSRSEFIKICLEETHSAEEQFKSLWQKIGLSVDWDLCYSTISKSTRKLSQESFIKLYEKGFVYRKNEPALYCTTCRTSVAQAELEDREKPSVFYSINFELDFDGAKYGHDKHIPKEVTIATTRPELLGSCIALFYHPDDKRYQELFRKRVRVPLFNQLVPILEDDKVNPEKGTGLVMASTFGDKTDVEWYKKHNIDLHGKYRPCIGLDGKMIDIDPECQDIQIAGLTVVQAREKVVQELKARNYILEEKPINHMVNVHERCKKEIEILMLPQWFLKILPHKKALLAMADTIAWYPAHMKTRYIDWVSNIGWDWCLSRQRFFGIPFPAWHCNTCKEILLAPIEKLPIDPQETAYPGGTCTKCGSSDITADKDVMDTWNTSSITPYLCYALFAKSTDDVFEKAVRVPLILSAERSEADRRTIEPQPFLPMSMRPQAHDIIRTWAFYTITKSWMHNGIAPWTDIVISGHVLAGDKEKLSKSKDNAKMTPESLIEQHSADAIRYWTASGGLGTDVAFSESQIKIGHRLITKLWNAFRFVGEHTQEKIKSPDELDLINEWLLHEASVTFEKYCKAFERNEFGLALDAIENFFWKTFCDNYLEIIKDQLFNPAKYSPDQVAATRWTLHHVGLRILQWYAPFIPFITETLYEQWYKKQLNVPSLHTTLFSKTQTLFEFEKSAQLCSVLLEIVAQVRRLKTEKQLSLKTPIAHLRIYLPTTDLNLDPIIKQEQIIKGVCQAEKVTFEQPPLVPDGATPGSAVPSQLIYRESTYDADINLETVPLP